MLGSVTCGELTCGVSHVFAAAALGSGYSRAVLELSYALRGYVPPHWSVDAAWTGLRPDAP